jgi:hypothetical protein
VALGVLVGQGSRISRHSAHEDGKVVTLTHRPYLPPGISWYSFLEAESTPGHMELSDAPEKIPQCHVYYSIFTRNGTSMFIYKIN